MDGAGKKRKRRLPPSFLKWFARRRKSSGMTTAELIKFLVVRPDRKRGKRKPAAAKATLSSAPAEVAKRNSRPSRFQDMVKHSSTKSGADITFPTLTPVTEAAAAAAPAGTAVVVRPDAKSDDGLQIVNYKPGMGSNRNYRYYMIPEDIEQTMENAMQITKGVHDVKNRFTDLKEKHEKVSEEKEKVSKEKDAADAKAAEFAAKVEERRQKDYETEKLAVWMKLVPIAGLKKGVPAAAGKSHKALLEYWFGQGRADVVKAHEKAEAEAKKKYPMGGSGTAKIGALMTSDIDRMMAKVPGFAGAIARNGEMKAPAHPPATGVSWVMNMDPSTKPGSHWVAVLLTPSSVEYCNSFGEECPHDIKAKITAEANRIWPGKPKTFKVNRVKRQDARTSTCGYHAMKFIVDRVVKGKTFPAATGYDDVNRVRKSEAEVRKFEEQFPKFSQAGDGLFSLDDKAPNAVRKALERYGDWKMLTIRIVRKPIASAIGDVLNAVSLGAYKEALKSKGYDKMFHLAMYVRIEPPGATDGSGEKVLKIEKNATVGVSEGNVPQGRDVESVPAAPRSKLVKDLFARQSDPGFWLYDPFKNNCQDFILKLLTTIGSATPQATAFIKQDGEAIGQKLGWFTRTVAKAATDLGGRIDGAVDKVKEATGQNGGWTLRQAPIRYQFVHDATGITHPFRPQMGAGDDVVVPMHRNRPGSQLPVFNFDVNRRPRVNPLSGSGGLPDMRTKPMYSTTPHAAKSQERVTA